MRKLKSVQGLTVIGVTGSYGKTSVKFYLQTLLQEKYNVLVTPGEFQYAYGCGADHPRFPEAYHRDFCL